MASGRALSGTDWSEGDVKMAHARIPRGTVGSCDEFSSAWGKADLPEG